MQYTVDILETDTLKDSREVINKRDEALRSSNSGTAFPSVDLVIGMHCYRTDLKEEFILDQITPTVIWRQVAIGVPVDISKGGTGAVDSSTARVNLGLGTAAVENTVPVSKGGTGATTAPTAKSNLGINLDVTQTILPPESGGTGVNSIVNLKTALGLPQSPVSVFKTNDVIPIANGGTAATNAATARSNLGLGSSAIYNVGTGAGQIPVLNSQGGLQVPMTQNTSHGRIDLTSGTSFAIPAGIYSAIVTIIGGGGGKGKFDNFIQYSGGDGGALSIPISFSPNSIIYYSIGHAGTSSGTSAGTSGGATTFSYNGISAIATGGEGGAIRNSFAIDGTPVKESIFKIYGLGDKWPLFSLSGMPGAIIIEY